VLPSRANPQSSKQPLDPEPIKYPGYNAAFTPQYWPESKDERTLAARDQSAHQPPPPPPTDDSRTQPPPPPPLTDASQVDPSVNPSQPARDLVSSTPVDKRQPDSTQHASTSTTSSLPPDVIQAALSTAVKFPPGYRSVFEILASRKRKAQEMLSEDASTSSNQPSAAESGMLADKPSAQNLTSHRRSLDLGLGFGNVFLDDPEELKRINETPKEVFEYRSKRAKLLLNRPIGSNDPTHPDVSTTNSSSEQQSTAAKLSEQPSTTTTLPEESSNTAVQSLAGKLNVSTLDARVFTESPNIAASPSDGLPETSVQVESEAKTDSSARSDLNSSHASHVNSAPVPNACIEVDAVTAHSPRENEGSRCMNINDEACTCLRF
jgi:hypothetical protein